MKNKKVKCSFCGNFKDKRDVIEGIDGYICFNCVDKALEIVDINKIKTDTNISDFRPHKIKEYLDKYIIGQDKAKEMLSVEVYKHYKRISLNKDGALSNIEFPKVNILLIGPTGSGKTLLMQRLSKMLDVPLVISDATQLTSSGYVGKSVDTLLLNLYKKSKGNISKVEKGIIYIDEIDKLSTNTETNSKDISGKGVQEELLTILGGSEHILDIENPDKSISHIKIDTKNILFVVGGSFNGIDKIVKNRTNKQRIGFNLNVNNIEQNKNQILDSITTNDLYKFGFIKDFIGRLQLIVPVYPLTQKQLQYILVKPKNALIKKYISLFKTDNIDLEFKEDSIEYISYLAYKSGTGARALDGLLAYKLNKIQYEMSMKLDSKNSSKLEITKKVLENIK